MKWISVLLAIVIAALGYCGYRIVITQVRRAKTYDTMGALFVAFGHLDPASPITAERVLKEMKRRFPEIKVIDTSVLDEWQHPIKIEIRGGEMRLRSAGPDGVMNTSDDLTQSATMR
jgi:hypothetical protein